MKGWNLRISGVERYISDVPVSRNWHKTVLKSRRLYVKYTFLSRDQNPLQWQCSILVTWYIRRHVKNTALPLVRVLVTFISTKKEKLLNSNNNRSKIEFLRLLLVIVVFRLVAYLLNMICLMLQILYKIVHIYVFIYVLYVSFNPWDSQVSSFTPFHFSLTAVPLNFNAVTWFYCVYFLVVLEDLKNQN